MLWWKHDRRGYTTDISQAGQYNRADAEAIMRNRDTDRAWPVEYIESKITPTVNFDHVEVSKALPND